MVSAIVSRLVAMAVGLTSHAATVVPSSTGGPVSILSDVPVEGGRLVVTKQEVPGPTTREKEERQAKLPPNTHTEFPERAYKFLYTMFPATVSGRPRYLWGAVDGEYKGVPRDYCFTPLKADVLDDELVVIYQQGLSVWAHTLPAKDANDPDAKQRRPTKLVQGSELYGPVVTKVRIDCRPADDDLTVSIYDRNYQIGKFILSGAGADRRWRLLESDAPHQTPTTLPFRLPPNWHPPE